MALSLEFQSKDSLLAEYYALQFMSMFYREAAIWYQNGKYPPPWDDLEYMWERRMLLDAEFQEHYDYEVVDGLRKPLLNEDGSHKYLIPKVVIRT